MSKLSQKRNLSSIQVIKTLKALFQDDYSMAELVDKLNSKEPDSVFNNSVISKYINTCRQFGAVIPKINNKYYVSHLPFGLQITMSEFDLLNNIKFVINRDMAVKNKDIFENFIQKISRFADKDIMQIKKGNYEYSIEFFEKAVAKKRMVRLLFKNQAVFECIPLGIIEKNNKKYFNVLYKKERIIDLNRLSGIEILGTKFPEEKLQEEQQACIFRLTGALAKRYEARENETIDLNSDGSISVTNKSEPKDELFSRLMRYDTSCEILFPQEYRTEFKQMIINTLKNYGEQK